ncbi:MAG: META domain-containing protein [Ignavibacteriaceae bacterium]|nr:META domain-containing protein [Ignavibacteriaceae bacterium]
MKKKDVLLLLLITVIIPNCSSSKEEADIRLHDIWAIESIESYAVLIDESIKNLPVLEIYVAEKRVHGNTGCNTINGEVNIDGNNITFQNIVTTEMACPGNLEQRFLTNLIKVNRYKIEKLRLHLFEDDKELMVFKKID